MIVLLWLLTGGTFGAIVGVSICANLWGADAPLWLAAFVGSCVGVILVGLADMRIVRKYE